MSVGTNPPLSPASVAHFATSTISATAIIGTAGDAAVVSNLSNGNLYLAFGVGSLAASVGVGALVLPGMQRVVSVPPGATLVAAVLDAGTGTAHVERGYGSAR